jgi:hypothetical protein
VTKNCNDPIGDQLFRGGDCLLSIAVIVGRDHLDVLAEHAAFGVEMGRPQSRRLAPFPRPARRKDQSRARRRRP